jgi:zinc transport system permease protein
MLEILQYEFMRNALLAAFLASIACGIVGTYVVVKRIVFIGDGIAHAAFGGIGLGYLLNVVPPTIIAIPFSLAAALGLGSLSKKTKVSEDAAIGMLLTGGMALGIIFIGMRGGYAPDLFSYLFGNILTVPQADLFLMAVLDALIIITVYLFQREFSAISFDEEYARVTGIPTKKIYLLLLCLIALTVVLLIRVVGVILVMALLTIPAAIARQHTHEIRKMMIAATLSGIALTCTGLYLSYVFDLASGATIVLVSLAAFLGSTAYKSLKFGR